MFLAQFARNALLTVEEVAYAAGFFDGEGHIRIQKHSSRCDTFLLQVSLTQATPYPLDWFVEKFGGTTKGRVVPYKDGKRTIYNWQSSSFVAERFLRVVLPYLRVKRDEADLALRFRGTFRPQHIPGGHKRMDTNTLALRRAMAGQLRQMRKDKRSEASLVAYGN
jgi:hypothetical protein